MIIQLLTTGIEPRSQRRKTHNHYVSHIPFNTFYVGFISLSSVCPLRNFPMLETLDVKNNLVSGKY